ncbi:MAG: hypothetical protein P8076_08490 [Gammaproteobacteria bacterium]
MNGFVSELTAGQITWLTAVVWIGVGVLCGLIGGALGGLKVGAEALGKELALLMGAFYGPFASAPGILLALIVLALVKG